MTPNPIPVKMMPLTRPRRAGGTCGRMVGAASTISTAPANPATKRQRKNQVNDSGQAQAKNDTVASSMFARRIAAALPARRECRASTAPAR